MRLAPGFRIESLVVSSHGCSISIEVDGGRLEQYKIVVTPDDTSLTKYAKTASEALENAAGQLDRMAGSIRQLKSHIDKEHQ
jgi:hypothetical protein